MTDPIHITPRFRCRDCFTAILISEHERDGRCGNCSLPVTHKKLKQALERLGEAKETIGLKQQKIYDLSDELDRAKASLRTIADEAYNRNMGSDNDVIHEMEREAGVGLGRSENPEEV